MSRSFFDFEIQRIKFLVENAKDPEGDLKFFFQNNGFLGSELTVANEKLKNKRHYANNWIIVPKTNRFIILVSFFE